MSVLKIKDQNGQWTDVLSIKGEKGDNGQDYVLTENDKQEIAQDVAELVDIPVDDVQIDGASIVQNGVAEIPVGGQNKFGVFYAYQTDGVASLSDGRLVINPSTDDQIKGGQNTRRPIIPAQLDKATFYGLAKASGDTTQSQSSNAVGTYTDEAKTSIQSMLGVPSEDDVITDVQVNGTSVVSNGIADISIPEPEPKGMVVKTTLVSGNQYRIDSTYDIIKATLSAGINVIVMAQNTPQPYVGNIQMDGVWYLAFGVSTTYNNYATLMGFLIPETYQNIAVWVEQSVHIPTLDDSDINVNMVWSSSRISNELSQKVGDVQIDGTSIVQNGVANVPIASDSQMGAVKVAIINSSLKGIYIDASGVLRIAPPTSARIKAGVASEIPITLEKQHESTFYGLAKAAGSDEKDSTLPVGQYTDSAKASICEMLGLPYERLIYRDDTFGNVWDERQVVSFDVENSTVTINDASNIPTDAVSDNRFAYLVYKPILNLQYGSLPTELIGINRIKHIGDNKIQFYKDDGTTLVTFTDTECLDPEKCRLLVYNGTPQNLPLIQNLQANHKYHARLFYNGWLPDSSGICLNNTRDGISYDQKTAHRRQTMMGIDKNNTIFGSNEYDGYACIAGNRIPSSTMYYTSLMNATFGQFDIWIEPFEKLNGYKYSVESLHMCSNNSNKKEWMQPRFTFSRGFGDNVINSIKLVLNYSKDRFSNGCVFEVWDCGTHF